MLLPLRVAVRVAKSVYDDVQDFRGLRREYIASCQERQMADMTIYSTEATDECT